MFGFLKRRLRKEHRRLVNETLEMAEEVEQVFSLGARVFEDAEGLRQAHEIKRMIPDLVRYSAMLHGDGKEHLPPEDARAIMSLHRWLTDAKAGIDRGRAIAKQKLDGE